MTDNEIIKTYECCFINGGDCNECPLMTVDCMAVNVRGLVLDLIKRTKLESKRYRGKCSGQKVELTRLYEENNRQKAEIERLQKFKTYFDGLYGINLEVEGWHENGNTISFDEFYDSAIEDMDSVKELTHQPTKIEHNSLCETETYKSR